MHILKFLHVCVCVGVCSVTTAHFRLKLIRKLTSPLQRTPAGVTITIIIIRIIMFVTHFYLFYLI